MSVDEQKEIDKVHSQLDDVQDSLKRVLYILESDSATNERGLVERVRVIEVQLNKLLLREEIYKAKGTVWGIIGGAIITVVLYLGKFLITRVF